MDEGDWERMYGKTPTSNNTRTEMTTQITKEQLIRVKILPQLESVSDFLLDCHDNSTAKHFGRKLDKITEELITILNDD